MNLPDTAFLQHTQDGRLGRKNYAGPGDDIHRPGERIPGTKQRERPGSQEPPPPAPSFPGFGVFSFFTLDGLLAQVVGRLFFNYAFKNYDIETKD